MPHAVASPRKPVPADTLFKAFSDRTRLRILNILRTGETCVCDLMTVLAAPQAKISRHLAYLRRAGLVEARKEGLWHHYRLSAAQSKFHRKLLECIDCCLSDVPELKRDLKAIRRRSCGPDGACGSDGCCD